MLQHTEVNYVADASLEGKFVPVHAMVSYRRVQGMEVWLQSFLTSALDGSAWSTLRPGSFTFGKRNPVLNEQEAKVLSRHILIKVSSNFSGKCRHALCSEIYGKTAVTKIIAFCWVSYTVRHMTVKSALNQPSRDAHNTTRSNAKQHNIFLIFYL
jgi:hypothetical protein